MKRNLPWQLLVLAAAPPATCVAHDAENAPPVIPTTSGRVTGKVDPDLPNVWQYLGIPYAVPPVGERRWTAPELLNQPDADIQTTSLPPSCLQYWDANVPSLFSRDVLEYNVQGLNTTGAISEDCLTLSIWAPANTTASPEGVPVLIFIYGGGFGVGGQDVPYQIPAQWVDRSPDHIVVSFNYRLGIFGFPNAGGLPDQNLAMLDTRAVVEWLRDNVGAFGGDPSRMVLWGQSAGAMMADYYGFAYPEDPVVTGLIMDSGTAFTPFFTVNDTARSNFSFVADHVGCSGLGDDPVQQLSCMRSIDGDVINDFVANYSETGGMPGLAFVPVEDNTLIFSNYTERASGGMQAKIVSSTDSRSLLAFDSLKTDTSQACHRRDQRPGRPHLCRVRPERPQHNRRSRVGPGSILLPRDQHCSLPATDRPQGVPLRVLRQLYKRGAAAVDGRLPRIRAAHPDGHSPKLPWEQHA